jgi:glc operon protein GlcG
VIVMDLLRSAAIAALFASGAAIALEPPVQPVLTLSAARSVVESALAAARQRNAPGAAIAVVDAGGQLVALERLDGTFPAAPSVSTGKARTAVAFAKPTRLLEDAVNKGRYTMTTLPEITSFTPLQGGVPLTVGGRIVGAIGVSGASSAQQDDEIAQAAADAFAGGAARADVEYRPAAQVKRAFVAGDALIDSPEFKVNASRRDAPGEGEVHLRDTDIFYVVDGSAEFVAGGELVEPRAAGDGELRGREVRGGRTYHLAKGDVITVPRGVPHWFRTVGAPLVYYVVKSTSPEG